MIKAIVFDCFGVLTTDLWKEFKSTLPPDMQQAAHDINHAYDAGFISEKEFIEQVRELTGKNPGEVENLTQSETTKNTDLLEFIKTLKPKYKIGMLSNIASNWVRDTFLTAQEQKLFDVMVFSYEIKVTKPSPLAFKAVCEKLNVLPKEAIMIDDIDSYCQSAESIGMKFVVYQNFVQMKQDLEKILALA